ncbi:MAG: cobalt ECF transporter T component CbiQ [Candidatus Methanoperedens sp.]|nr:cobalt ECF transporter T component CbiQ [Candidatus Methanoperedens sp.]
MHISLTELERETYKKSPIHGIDGRIKILVTLMITVYAVSLGRLDPLDLSKLAILEVYLLILMLFSKLEISHIVARFSIAIPFGLGISILQPFIKQPFMQDFSILYIMPMGIEITREGLLYGAILFSKFIVCISSLILLSSTTPMSELVASARRLGLPKVMALLFTMMVRYLFVFWYMLGRIRTAQKTRCFEIWNKKIPRKWILEQIGFTISSLFIRSYEQGERTYQSMLCRGYNVDTSVYIGRKKLHVADIILLVVTLIIITIVHLMIS